MADPGAIFAQSLQSGVQSGLQLRGQEIEQGQFNQKLKMNMAEMAQHKEEFGALQYIREQQLDLDKTRTMAQINAFGTAQQLDQIKVQQQQYALDQMPKMEANNAYFQRLLSSPQAQGMDGADWVSQKLGEAPHPDILNPTETQGLLAKVRTSNAASSLGIAQQNKMASNLQLQAEAMQSGIDISDYLKNPQEPATPENINIVSLSQAINSNKIRALQTAEEIKSKSRLTEIEAQGKNAENRANILVGAKGTSTDKNFILRSHETARKALADLQKNYGNEKDIKRAQEELSYWERQAKSVIDGDQPAASSMQDPSGLNPYKGASYIKSIIGE